GFCGDWSSDVCPADLVELLGARCARGTAPGLATVPRSSTLPDDPGDPLSRSLDRDMRATRNAMRRTSPSASERAAAQRACEEADTGTAACRRERRTRC